MINIISKQDLIKTHELLNLITANFKEEDIHFNLNIDELFLQMYCLTPQQYGIIAQKHFQTLLGYENISSILDRGDMKNNEEEYIEFKCSFIDNYANSINIRQIRQYQSIDYYYIFTVDFKNVEEIIYKLYKLSKEQMEEECLFNNASSCHMTKDNHSKNEKVELGFQIEVGSDTYKRWESKFLKKEFDIKRLSSKRLLQLNNFEDRQNYYQELAERNNELETLSLELYKSKGLVQTEEQIIIEEVNTNKYEEVLFKIKNNFKLTKYQQYLLFLMNKGREVDNKTFEEHYTQINFEEQTSLIESILLSDKILAKERKQLKDVNHVILGRYNDEIISKLPNTKLNKKTKSIKWVSVNKNTYFAFKLSGCDIGLNMRIKDGDYQITKRTLDGNNKVMQDLHLPFI